MNAESIKGPTNNMTFAIYPLDLPELIIHLSHIIFHHTIFSFNHFHFLSQSQSTFPSFGHDADQLNLDEGPTFREDKDNLRQS